MCALTSSGLACFFRAHHTCRAVFWQMGFELKPNIAPTRRVFPVQSGEPRVSRRWLQIQRRGSIHSLAGSACSLHRRRIAIVAKEAMINIYNYIYIYIFCIIAGFCMSQPPPPPPAVAVILLHLSAMWRAEVESTRSRGSAASRWAHECNVCFRCGFGFDSPPQVVVSARVPCRAWACFMLW